MIGRLIRWLRDALFMPQLDGIVPLVRAEWPRQYQRFLTRPEGGHIRIDEGNYGAGQRHAHIYARKGDQLGVVNVDGSGSHGTRMRLSRQDAALLRAQGFNIRRDRVVDWHPHQPTELMELGKRLPRSPVGGGY